ncbi:MAG TPA: hypothetical protein VI141_07350 [Acidimicrobiia bacterium]
MTCMRESIKRDDRGAGLVEYALLVLLIALGGLGAISYVGDTTSTAFEETATSFADGSDVAEEEMTPAEKWEKAKADYDEAIADAKADKAASLDKANADYQAALEANKSLPKADQKAANQTAKNGLNTAKTAANDAYKASVDSANAAKAAAKSDYNATK